MPACPLACWLPLRRNPVNNGHPQFGYIDAVSACATLFMDSGSFRNTTTRERSILCESQRKTFQYA